MRVYMLECTVLLYVTGSLMLRVSFWGCLSCNFFSIKKTNKQLEVFFLAPYLKVVHKMMSGGHRKYLMHSKWDESQILRMQIWFFEKSNIWSSLTKHLCFIVFESLWYLFLIFKPLRDQDLLFFVKNWGCINKIVQ